LQRVELGNRQPDPGTGDGDGGYLVEMQQI